MIGMLIILAVILALGSGMGTGAVAPASYGYGSGGGDVVGTDQDVLARTIYGEARNQSYAAMCGVANVVMNRSQDTFHFPEGIVSVAAVCQQPYQFSCWNAHDPNLSVIQSVNSDNSVFQTCLTIAGDALSGDLTDNTGGAQYYYDTSIAQPSFWLTDGIVRTVSIGAFVFGRKE